MVATYPESMLELWPTLTTSGTDVDIYMSIPAVTNATYTISADTEYESILELWDDLDSWCTAHADPDINNISWEYDADDKVLRISVTGEPSLTIKWDNTSTGDTTHRDAAGYSHDLSGDTEYTADAIALTSVSGWWRRRGYRIYPRYSHYLSVGGGQQYGSHGVQGSQSSVMELPEGYAGQWLIPTETRRTATRSVFIGNGDFGGLAHGERLSMYEDVTDYASGRDSVWWWGSDRIRYAPRRMRRYDRRYWILDVDLREVLT